MKHEVAAGCAACTTRGGLVTVLNPLLSETLAGARDVCVQLDRQLT
jgi:hypothetical protein